MVGSLVLEIIGTEGSLDETLKYFTENGVKIEVIA